MSLLTLPPVDEILASAIFAQRTIPAVRTGLVLPSPLLSNLPFVTVSLLPGSSSPLDMSVAVDIDVYAATRGGPTGGRAVSGMVEAIITNAPIRATVAAKNYVLDTVAGSTFHEVPWDDDTVRHYLATIQVDTRRV